MRVSHEVPRAGPRPDASGRPRRAIAGVWLAGLGSMLVVGGIGFLLARAFYDNYDGLIMGQVATGILDRHSVTVLTDPFRINSPYSSYGLGMSVLMLPTIVTAKIFGASEAMGAMATNAWLLAAVCGVTFAWCRLRACGILASSAVSLLVGLGAGLLPFASTGFAEVGLALAVVSGMYGLTATSLGRGWGPFVVGAAAGWSVVMRDDSLLLVVPWLVAGAWLLADQRRAAVMRVIAGATPFAVLWCWYNTVRFGVPWKLGYGGVEVFNHSLLKGLYGYVASPARGLLFYAPVILVAIVGAPRAWRRKPALVLVAAGLLCSRPLFFAPYWGWSNGGGFGPRYILPATPVLALGLIEVAAAFGTLRLLVKASVAGVACLSIAVGFVGGAVDYSRGRLLLDLQREPALQAQPTTGRAFLQHLESPAVGRAVDRHMFNWGEFPITNETSLFLHRRAIGAAALARPASRVRFLGATAIVVGGLALLGAGLKAGDSGVLAERLAS